MGPGWQAGLVVSSRGAVSVPGEFSMWMMLMVCVAAAELEMVPEDGRCLPGDMVVVYAPAFDTGGPRTCLWSAEAGLVAEEEDDEGDVTVLTCPDCGRRRQDEIYGVYTYCTDEDQNPVWIFDEIVLACSEIEGEPEPESCGCGTAAVPAAWSLLLLPGVVLRRRRVGG
mgnify:CR=1 FL=1